MPFSLADPDAFINFNPVSPGAPASALRTAVEAEAAAAQVRAQHTLAKETALLSSLRCGEALAAVYATFNAERAAISSDIGGDTRLGLYDAAEARKKAGVQRLVGILDRDGDALEANARTQSLGIMTSDMASHAGFIYTAQGVQLASKTLDDAEGTLDDAMDPLESNEGKTAANVMLHYAYDPILARNISAGPKHFAPFMSRAEDLHDLITTHLDSVLDGPRTRLYAAAVAAVRADFTWLVRTADASGWTAKTDAALRTGAPSLFPPR